MPSPKSGTAGTVVSPTAPQEAHAADDANPGDVEKVKAEQRKTKKGKYGSEKVDPYKPPKTLEEKKKKKSWIEIKMVDENNRPVTGMGYRITLPDNTVAEGALDDKGSARIDGIEKGNCKVSFPKLDQEFWKKV
jgi:hypothetical protein